MSLLGYYVASSPSATTLSPTSSPSMAIDQPQCRVTTKYPLLIDIVLGKIQTPFHGS